MRLNCNPLGILAKLAKSRPLPKAFPKGFETDDWDNAAPERRIDRLTPAHEGFERERLKKVDERFDGQSGVFDDV